MRRLLLVLLGGVIFMPPAVEAATVCTFIGQIDFRNKEVQLEVAFSEKEKVVSSFKVTGNSAYLNAQIEHLKISQADLSTNLEGSFNFERNAEGRIKNLDGVIWSRYSILNHKPFKEIVGSFHLKDGKLSIDKLTWAEAGLSGWLDLKPPFDGELAIEITDMEISELAPLAGVKTEKLLLSGLVSGRLRLTGRLLGAMQMKGQLRSSKGQVEDFIYHDANLNFSGPYPALDIVDSAISDEQGYIYNLVGRFNLLEINNFTSSQHQIKVSPFSEQDFRSQSWTIKREGMGQDSELEFGYRLKPDRPSQILSEGTEGMLGVERKHKF
jgi:hypothetical protein